MGEAYDAVECEVETEEDLCESDRMSVCSLGADVSRIRLTARTTTSTMDSWLDKPIAPAILLDKLVVSSVVVLQAMVSSTPDKTKRRRSNSWENVQLRKDAVKGGAGTAGHGEEDPLRADAPGPDARHVAAGLMGRGGRGREVGGGRLLVLIDVAASNHCCRAV